MTAVSTEPGAELMRFLDQAFSGRHADIGDGTEQSFRFAVMMARKARLPQGADLQIPRLGMSAAAFFVAPTLRVHFGNKPFYQRAFLRRKFRE